MASAFISYSRRDRDFVLSLLPALRQLQHEVWVDTDDIPPSAEWMKEIQRAIRGSDCVICVVTPNSVVSRICLEELDFATRHAKRLIPVLREPVEATTVPQVLAKLHWISMTVRDSFDDGVAAVNKAIVTDLEWVHTHTGLLERCDEWHVSERDRNRLLRGQALIEAQAWLAKHDGIGRVATPSQREYIAASEADATRRRRIAIGLAAAAGIAAVVAGTAIAIERAGRLGEEIVKRSQALANQSTQYVDQRLDLALLLSLAALDQSHTVDARASLVRAVEHNPALSKFLHGHHGALRSLALTPDGSVLASGGCAHPVKDEKCQEGEIRLWSFPSGEPRPNVEVHIDGEVRALAFTPDGSRLAAGAGDKVLYWDLQTNTVSTAIEKAFAERINSIAFSPNGKWLATAGESDPVFLWHTDKMALDDWYPEFPTNIESRNSNDVAFDPGGQLLAAATDRWLHVWDFARRTRLDRRYGAEQRQVEVPGANAIANVLAFTAAGSILVVGSAKGDVTFWDVRQGTQIASFPTPDEVWGVAVTPDAGTVMAGTGQAVRVWRATPPMPAWTSPPRNFSGHAAKVTAVALSQSGGRSVSADEDGRLILWNLERRSALGHEAASPLREVPSAQAAAMTSDGRVFAVSTGDTVSLRTRDGAQENLAESLCAGSPVRSVAFSPAGDRIACGYDAGVVRLIELTTPRRESRFESHAERVTAVAISRDGQRLAAGVCTSTDANLRCLGSVFVWDIASGRLLRRHAQQKAEIPAVVFGSTILASANRNGDVVVYRNPAGSDAQTPLPDASSALTAIALSVDDRTIVTGSAQGAIRLWDVAEGRPLGDAIGLHRAPVLVLGFADSQTVVSVARDSLVEWPASLDTWIAAACDVANRNLSRTEWEKYVQGVAYRKLCVNVTSGEGAPLDAPVATYGLRRERSSQ